MMFLTPRTDGCCGTIDTRPMSNLIMQWNIKTMCVASRGRGDNNAQHFEARTDGCTSTITSVAKDNYLMEIETPYNRQLQEQGIRLPAVLCKIRTDEGREKRKQGIEVFRYKFLTPRTDGMCNTLTGVQKDNLIMTTTDNKPPLTYHPNPTKEDLLEYFGQRIRVRKMTPREALRLMDVDDSDIDKIENATETVTLKDGTAKTKKAISKTAMYKLAGNSIVVSCLYNIFRTLFIPNQPENERQRIIQPSLFD